MKILGLNKTIHVRKLTVRVLLNVGTACEFIFQRNQKWIAIVVHSVDQMFGQRYGVVHDVEMPRHDNVLLSQLHPSLF